MLTILLSVKLPLMRNLIPGGRSSSRMYLGISIVSLEIVLEFLTPAKRGGSRLRPDWLAFKRAHAGKSPLSQSLPSEVHLEGEGASTDLCVMVDVRNCLADYF